MVIYSGNIGSTNNSTKIKLKSSEKLELIQFTQPWVGVNNDYKISQNLFTEYLEEQTTHR